MPFAYIRTVRHASVWVAAVRGRIGTIRASANFNYADYAASAAASKAAAQPPAGQSSAAQSSAAQSSAPQPSAATQGVTFHEVLSELNPLQYIPVVGTIYRSITGDTIPEPVRMFGSMIVSGLLGGPVGLALSIAALSVEKATGFDPEVAGHSMLASLGIGTADSPVAVAAVAPPAPVHAGPDQATPNQAIWSPTQLAAYGVTAGADGTLHHGDLSGSDVLNDLELAYLGPAQAAAGTTLLASAAPAA